MRINILIRAYTPNNLYTSLFDLPNKISEECVDIVVHNDNPEASDEFKAIIEEFKNKYPKYNIETILEAENQHMFMSTIKSIPTLNADNKLTMLLDEDDQLTTITKDDIDRLHRYSENYLLRCKANWASYNNGEIAHERVFLSPHVICPTSILKQLYTHVDTLSNLLMRHLHTTKVHILEDCFLQDILKQVFGAKEISVDLLAINHMCYEHEVNGYISMSSKQPILDIFKTKQAYKRIIAQFRHAVNPRKPRHFNLH